jgi:lysozyme family protein
VNAGPKQAALFLQRSLNVVADGVIGPKTLAAINAIPQDKILSLIYSYIDQRSDFYIDIVSREISQIMFLKGWLIRIRTLERIIKS